MSKKVTVVDYGVGNLLSVSRAFEKVECEVEVTSEPANIITADRLILPGVGAFSSAMDALHKRGLVEPIRNFVTTGRPFLGICLGMQMMLTESEEFGITPGFDLVKGRVSLINSSKPDGQKRKIPNIGWSELQVKDLRSPFFKDMSEHSAVYFVHSFSAQPQDKAHILATTDYEGEAITAVIGKDNVLGCQFHPRKKRSCWT